MSRLLEKREATLETPVEDLPYWENEVGRIVEYGLTLEDVKRLGQEIGVNEIKSEFLPGEDTILGKVSERKSAIFTCAERIWGVTAKDWMSFEAKALKRQRELSGVEVVGGKDQESDVVSAELAVRLLAACKIVDEFGSDLKVTSLAIRGLNLAVGEAVLKGVSRQDRMVDPKTGKDRSVYGVMRARGLMIGSGGGKYLPLSEETLPVILSLFDRNKVRQEVFSLGG